MKSFSLLVAVVSIALGSNVRADDPAPVPDNLSNVEGEQYLATDSAAVPPVASGAYTDFPNYGPGFSSYRGLGFMGSCCEQTSRCAQNAWDGYCESKDDGHNKPFHGWTDKLHGWLPKSTCCPPAKSCDTGCDQKGCPEPIRCETKPWRGLHFGWKRPACGVKAECYDKGCDQKGCPEPSCSDVAPKFGKPLCDKLHSWRGHWGGLWHGAPAEVYGKCCEPTQDAQMWMPTERESPRAAPVPEPTAEPGEGLPLPEVTTEYVPEFPDDTTRDRSANRRETRRTPNVFMSF